MSHRCRVLLVSGSLRNGSTNTALLRTARLIAPAQLGAFLYDGLRQLPHFDPDDDRAPLHPAVAELRASIRASDAIMFSTPEYAGALPGSFKNLLDWTIGDDAGDSIHEKPVCWINASSLPTGAANAHDSLRIVLGYAHAKVVEDACSLIPVSRTMIGDDGFIGDEGVRSQILNALSRLVSGTPSCF